MRPSRIFFAVFLITALISTASTFTSGPLVLVSGPSPFASCTIGGPGTNYVNAEVEPYVAVNPTNSKNIIGVVQQDRWSNGGAHGLTTAFSFDGGATWGETFAHFSTCSGGTPANGGDFDRASDPWVTFSPNGIAYQISLSASADLLQLRANGARLPKQWGKGEQYVHAYRGGTKRRLFALR